jgi:riboflavin synthase
VFTGLVNHCVPAIAIERRGGAGARLTLANPWPAGDVALGESICVSGCCLTVAGPPGRELAFDLSAETLARTWFERLAPGALLNLERSLRLSDRLGGHLVSGHVDGIGEIARIADTGDGGRLLTFRVPPALERYLIDKGSVALDGISLTVVEPRGAEFDVAVIPLTLEHTHLGRARVGQPVNIEADLVGKWIEQLSAPARRAK